MISLVLAMFWSRRGQAVTLALLALFAVASAVAAPAFLAAADRAVAAGQIATATPAERGLVISAVQNDRPDPDSLPGVTFTDVAPALVSMPGFTYVFAAEVPVVGLEPTTGLASQVVFRLGFCAHLRMISGRCPVSDGEAVIGAPTAARLKLEAGDPVTVTFATLNKDTVRPAYEPDGEPKTLTIVGTYRVADPRAAYWGTHGYFSTIPGRPAAEPVFLSAATLKALDHGDAQVSIDGTAGPAALDIDGLGELRTGLAELRESSVDLGPTIQIDTRIPALLERIDAGRAAARVLVPVLAVPLVLLACFSIFLAVGYGTEGRQPELAVVALRGARWRTRWWLATGESLTAVLLGAAAGCLAGQLLVNLVAATRFPGVGVEPGWSSLRYAPYAALAALLAAVLAQRRQLLSSVAVLLRRNPAGVSRTRALIGEVFVVLLAVVTGVQLFLSGGSVTGVGVLAPAFIVLALALLVARTLLPIVTRFASHALRSGRLGVALAGFQLARRPGAQRLFALLIATTAVVGYAACAVDVAANGRAVEAGLGVGADRVLTVGDVQRGRLLTAVRNADPGGTFAMAVTRLPNGSTGEPLGLAVDATRLATVATWPAGATPADAVADRLHPAVPDPVQLPGSGIAVDVTASGMARGKVLQLALAVSSLNGLGDATVRLGDLRPGRSTYRQRVDVCREGCRIRGIQLNVNTAVPGITGAVVIHGLSGADAGRIADPAGWRMPELGRLSAAPDGLRIELEAPGGLPDGAWVRPADTPSPLPAANAGPAPAGGVIRGLDGGQVQVTPVAGLPAIPRAGRHATLVDLEYADRLAVKPSSALEPQVWLNASAPADVLARLAAQGLEVVDDTRAEQVRRRLDQQGPALALWFYVLAGTLAALLGAGALVLAAAVDQARRIEDLAALRAQGLRRPPLNRATLWTYPVLVLIAALAGVLTGLIAWGLTGWALPLAGLNPPDLPLPRWPHAPAVAGTTLAVLAVLAVVAALTGRDLRRRVNRTHGRPDG